MPTATTSPIEDQIDLQIPSSADSVRVEIDSVAEEINLLVGTADVVVAEASCVATINIEVSQVQEALALEVGCIPILGGTALDGAVFALDVSATGGSILEKDYENDALISFTSDTNDVVLSLVALTGHSQLSPTITVNGVEATLTENSLGVYTGNYSINVSGVEQITLKHDDGATSVIEVNVTAPPEVLDLTFGDYPGTQTQLKAGDSINITISTDREIDRVEIDSFGALQSGTLSFSATTSATVSATVANQGTSVADYAAKVRVRDTSGSWSSWYTSTATVTLCNLYPSITFNSITYPASQGALKDSEQATIDHTVSNFDTISYSTSGGQLTIPNIDTYESSKTVTRASGTYNVSTNNFLISATRNANDATTTSGTCVRIANAAASLSVSCASRLRSSPTGLNHVITLQGDQLLQTASMDRQAGSGTWANSWSGSGSSRSRTLTVTDAETKGTYTWHSISATNLSGIETTSVSNPNYILGGFSNRRITFGSFSQYEPLGVSVADTSKLSVSDMSGASFSYQADKTDGDKVFTITDSAGTLDADGNYIWVADQGWVDQNSTGTAYLDVEETI